MRALVQRVSSASVTVGGETVGSIGPGMAVLLGIARADTPEVAERLVGKLRRLRIFEDAEGRTNEPLGEGRGILCVSQFTLYASTRKGNRPSFTEAAPPEQAEPLYESVCDALGAERGRFGARMNLTLTNDGPLTLMVEVDSGA